MVNLTDLTIKQQLIVAWTAMGCTRKQIAGMLKLSLKTVEWYMTDINKVLGFSDPARLTHYALTAGLVEINQTV